MKKTLVLLSLILITLSGFSQSLFRSFLKPVTASDFPVQTSTRPMLPGATNQLSYSEWLILPDLSVTAVYLDLKTFKPLAFKQAGLAIGLNHFESKDGQPYNDYGFKALFLGGVSNPLNEPGEDKASFMIGLAASLRDIINLGPIIDTRTGHAGLLLNITYSLNKLY